MLNNPKQKRGGGGEEPQKVVVEFCNAITTLEMYRTKPKKLIYFCTYLQLNTVRRTSEFRL